MSKYVPDILSHRWVIISQSRIARPSDEGEKKNEICHFCEGGEKYTPGEVLRYGDGEKDKPGWKLRVFPNKYPITDYHEVIVHSPDDSKDIDQLPLSQTELILQAYRHRYNFYEKLGQVLIFCNHGFHAGASLLHPHSQLVVVPSQINLDTLNREPINNIVDENDSFTVYCPDFSQWPYEVWITPKQTNTIFGNITDAEITHLAKSMQQVLVQLKKIHANSIWSNDAYGYNYYIYHKTNWYIRIIPRFVSRAGFELGTGLNVNIVDPADAASAYRGMDKKVHTVLDKLKKYDAK